MSETELMQGYRSDRILVDSNRILSPQFSPSWAYLTGAQVEMLRNVVGYLRERRTFVDEYHGTYYIMPDDDDWDTVSAIVADLEEKIMGNANTPWGYLDQLMQGIDIAVGEDGNFVFDTSDVPSGEVWVVQYIDLVNFTASRGRVKLSVNQTTFIAMLVEEDSPPAGIRTQWEGSFTLKEGDFVRCRMANCLIDDAMYVTVWGYIMEVPG